MDVLLVVNGIMLALHAEALVNNPKNAPHRNTELIFLYSYAAILEVLVCFV